MVLKKIIRGLFHTGVLIVFLLLLLAAFLPMTVEHFANVFLQDFAAHGAVLIGLKRFNLSQIEFSFCAIPPEEPQYGAQSSYATCIINYSPLALLREKHLDSIEIHNVHFPLNLADDTIELPLLHVLKHTGSAEKETAEPESQGFRLDQLPVTIGKLEVSGNTVATLPERGDRVSEKLFIPVNFLVTSENGDWEKLRYTLKLELCGNTLHATGLFYPAENLLDGTTEINFDSRLLPFAVRERYLHINEVSAAVSSRYRYRLADDFPETFALEGKFGIKVDAVSGVSVTCQPEVAVAGDKNEVKASLSGVQCKVGNLPLALDAEAVWRRADNTMHGKLTPKAGETFTLPLDWSFAPQSEGWKLSVKTAARGVQSIFGVTFDAPAGTLELFMKNSGMEFTTGWNIGNVKTAFAGNQISLGSLTFQAGGTSGDLHASSALNALAVEAPLYKAELPDTRAFLSFKSPKEWNGEFKTSGAQVVCPKFGVTLKGISADFPFSREGGKGRIALAEIRCREHWLGSLSTDLVWPGDRSFQIAGGMFSLFRLDGTFEAEASFGENGPEGQARLTIPRQALRENLGLTELFPEQMDDKSFSGEAELEAVIGYQHGLPNGHASVALHDVAFDSEKLGIHVSGVKTKFEMPHLPIPASQPNLLLSFKAANMGPMSIGPGVIFYRMDAPDTWCIERLRVDWCEGTVRMESTYFSPESKLMIFTIHCERLDLMSFLAQTGIATGTGNGAGKISGTLPIVFQRDKSLVTVRDGFLYTTPGEEGNIKLELNETVRDAAQGIMMELSQEALRDFSYSWAKIGVNTKDNMQRVTLQLNGKPNQPLFYSYQNGEFVKSPIPHIFQGILLDVNFAVPCSELFYLYNQWNSCQQ